MTASLLHGWNPDLDIPTAITKVSRDLRDPCLVLIAVLDSTTEVSSLPSLAPFLEQRARWHATVDGDVVVALATLITCLDHPELFAGFDEIWLCDAMPTAGKPAHLGITSDRPLDSEPSPDLARWMRTASCMAGLGDGDGLNFATFDPALAAAWRPD